jgi:hypothetical protein
MNIPFEFYETPETFTRYLFWTMAMRGTPITGRCLEPCVGSGAIIRASDHANWVTNDLDTRWTAHSHDDACLLDSRFWQQAPAWTVTNPPFSIGLDIAANALASSRIGVAMYFRISIHEVLKEGLRRTFFRIWPPTGIIFLPRFAYQRSPKTGKWTTDSATACWVIWQHDTTAQFIDYAPPRVLDELDAETPLYRARMDEIMGFTGTEKERQQQRIALRQPETVSE